MNDKELIIKALRHYADEAEFALNQYQQPVYREILIHSNRLAEELEPLSVDLWHILISES